MENYIQNDEYNSVFVTFCTLDLTNVGVQRGRNYPDCERITVKGCFAWYSAGVYDVGGETEPARSHHPAACAKAEVGLVLFVLIETLGPVSGCHLNPTVTIAMLFTKNMKTKDGIQYIVVQLVGGFLGVIAGHAMFIGNDFFQWLTISEATRNGGAFWAEFVGTFMLVLVIFGTMRHKSSQPGLITGFLVGGFLITTSSTMFANPQVTFARMFTWSLAGIQPVDAVIFILVQFLAAIVRRGSPPIFSPLSPALKIR